MMSKEYPCVYYEKKLCKKFSKNGFTSFCAMGPCPHKTPSNADRIRSMSVDELAKMLTIGQGGFDCSTCVETADYRDCEQNCEERCLKWLQQPAEEVNNG